MAARSLAFAFAIAWSSTACGLFPDLSGYDACTNGCPTGSGGGAVATSSTSPANGSSTSSSVATTGVTSSGSGGPSPCALLAGMAGPEGVHVTPDSHDPYCIDATEVSVAQYRDFLEHHVENDLPARDFPDTCAWKANTVDAFTPRGSGDNPYLWTNYADKTHEQKPVQGVDWCDAAVYCAWAGKRLCGADDGGGPMSATTDPNAGWTQTGEWFRACIGPGETQYPYGGTYVPTACNTEDMMGDSDQVEPFLTTDVTAPSTCAAPWPDGNVYDLGGNVFEFEDNCVAIGDPGPEDDICYTRSGSYTLMDAGCKWAGLGGNGPTARNAHTEFLGVRCCWTP